MRRPNEPALGHPYIGKTLKKQTKKVKEYIKMFNSAYETFSQFWEDVDTILDMLSCKQWTDEDLQALGDRPALVINKMLGYVVKISGMQRKMAMSPTVIPVEPGDALPVYLFRHILKWALTKAKEQAVSSDVFMEKVALGLSYWKVLYDDDDDPEGLVKLERLHPDVVIADPTWLMSGWDKCRFVFHAGWTSEDDAIDRWPKYKKQIHGQFEDWLRLTSGGNVTSSLGDIYKDKRQFWDEKTHQVRTLELWKFKHRDIDIAVSDDGEVVTEDEEEIDFVKKKKVPGISIITRRVKEVYVCDILGEYILDERRSPWDYQKLPFFPALGFFFKNVPFGYGLLLEDLQRELNKRRSNMVEITGKMALGGYFNDETKGADKNELIKFSGGQVSVVNHKGVEPNAIAPPTLGQGLIYLEQRADSEMADIANVKPGARPQGEESQQGNTQDNLGQEYFFDTFREERTQVIEFIVHAIKQIVTEPRALRILGSLIAQDKLGPELQDVKTVLNPPPSEELNPEYVDAVRKALSDALTLEYDIQVVEEPYNPTLQLGQQQAVLNLLNIPKFQEVLDAELLTDITVDAGFLSPITAERIKERIKLQQQQQAVQSLGGAAVNVLPPEVQPGAVPPGQASPPKTPGVPSLPAAQQ